jgi:hypothetical protein
MDENKWIFIADAADFVGTKDVPLRIELALILKAIRLRGVRPGEREPVEITASEAAGLRIDCFHSRLVLGELITMYEYVQMRWVDVERLEHADVERLAREVRKAAASAAPPPKQGTESAVSTATLVSEAPPMAQQAETRPSADAPGGAKTSAEEAGRLGGKKSVKIRRENMKWISVGLRIVREHFERCPTASYASCARAIAKACQLDKVTCPEHKSLAAWVSRQRKPGGEFPA